MSEAKDPAIKLFGMTIPVLEIPAGSGESAGDPASSSEDLVDDGADQNHGSSSNSCKTNGGEEENEIDQDTMRTEDKKENGAPTESAEEITNLDTTSRSGEESVIPSSEKEVSTLNTSRTEEEHVEDSKEKTLKKPDKILPCPRCNSMETKFCYYNNYNVNQPRHFCKNCQRYWTAGGTMRNVPVGAGRRKNKNSTASHHRQITVPEATLQNPPPDFPNGVQHPSMNCNGAVLNFGSDTRLCESMTSVLNLADKTVNNCTTNGFNGPEELSNPAPCAGGEKGNDDDPTSSQPRDVETTNKSQEQVLQNFPSFPPQVPYFPGATWPFAWNPSQWSSGAPAFFPPGFTVPFYPATAYWGSTMPGAWNIPWIAQPLSPNGTTPNSLTLGKHSREENTSKSNDTADGDEHGKGTTKEKCLWVPKTLRIDDLGEAAKASIWTTLGIKTNKADSIHGEGRGIFKALPSKVDEEDHVKQNSQVLQANPAAMSRSISFHETS